ncbi:hypothetical protein N8I77_001042 [Diaporthe amygdali]|uniref:Heterokaryon incompatibility domain-containing protein n=1 Tax=Phomopsis amygdali TaxID=1214568 RepID=A0AAD9W917_PHOAM|nr:hypothetical protein N8I77_001042 [Diaporthe amygdali]
MRLINATSLKIEEFGPRNLPKYAILSHTWGDCEPTFAEWCSVVTRRWKSSKPGFAKVFATCKQARRDGLSHIWVDTVCIDKTSSAELSEAINSMFAWYEKAYVCYVYLADVPSQLPRGVDLLELMGSSRWFSRGWTLQELIAPDHVVFYSKSWTHLGTKKAFSSFLSKVSGIDQLCIQKEKALREYSIAQRMSWAADRVTTRPEDIAYCLLGVFGINMPLLYGEGNRAFIRLQEEIIRQSDDHSILAFNTPLSTNSLFADHPNLFRGMKNLQPKLLSRITPPFALTNAGLSLRTPLIQTLSPHWVLAVLNCVEVETKKGMRKSQLCLPLLGKNGVYMRARAPFSLIKKSLSEMYIPGIRTEIEDLTTPVETKYLVSHFTKVYPAFGYELDLALNGFDEDIMQNPGFMLTFPRGMGRFQLVGAYPADSLQMSTSFFNPPVADSGQPFAHGLLVFQDVSKCPDEEYPSKIGIYLAQVIDEVGGDLGGQWMCVLTRVSDGFNLYERCKQSWKFESPEDWSHYDHMGNFLVAARTRFALQEPTREVVMVEIVFDADVLTQEQGLDTAMVQFSDWVSLQGGMNGKSHIGLGSQVVLENW